MFNDNQKDDKKELEKLDKLIDRRAKLTELYLFFESKGLVTKTANLQDQRVYFCRGRELMQIFKDNEKYVANKLKEINGGGNDCSIDTFYRLCLEIRLLIKADKFDEDKKLKYPKKLKPLPNHELVNFEENKMFIVFIDRPVNKQNVVKLSLIIFVVLSLCLFRIWPLWFKLSVWWTLFIFLCTTFVFMLSRVFIYMFFYPFGYDVWFFPYFLGDNIPILESLKYPFAFEKREESTIEWIFSRGLLVLLLFSFYYFYQYPSKVWTLLDYILYLYKLALDWGNDKLTNYHTSSSSVQATQHDKHSRMWLENDL